MAKIVCAAVRCSNYEVVLGIRHYDRHMMETLAAKALSNFNPKISGFVNQDGKFYTREEAYKVAVAAGQIAPKAEEVLNSEDLY